ncbi:hypothetical protein FRC10_004401 [Ceratobasidium sp. 414]|nr:hypothetical protein FRC10_004401 [Ceratobasidium sp. 414]
MDSPLTSAELSRLRKAINQRERFLSQGLSVMAAESNILRAISNLKLYLPQSQIQLAAVLKDWEGADQATKTHIIIWLRQQILACTIADAAAKICPPSTSSAHTRENTVTSTPITSNPIPVRPEYVRLKSQWSRTQRIP